MAISSVQKRLKSSTASGFPNCILKLASNASDGLLVENSGEYDPRIEKMNRYIFVRPKGLSFRSGFCTGSKVPKNPQSASDFINSGGKSSYIGFGKFEGMSRETGSISRALEYLNEALKAHCSVGDSPENKRQEARFHHDMAMCHHRSTEIDSAIEKYKHAISILQKLLLETPSDDETASVIKRSRFDLSSAFSGLSVAYADSDMDDLSLEYALKATELRKTIMGPNHASVAECLNNLGGLYFRKGNFNKAAEVYQESLRILLTKTSGTEDNKYVALAYYNIGLTYDKLGIKKGRDAVHKALLIANHIFGPSHDQTIQIKNSLDAMNNST
jgi:tetratricopeptide (TPR) repeat protein